MTPRRTTPPPPRRRAGIREAQNSGTDAYKNEDYTSAKKHFETGIAHLDALQKAPLPSGAAAPPSRVFAERDKCRAKLLTFLGKCNEKLGAADEAKKQFADCAKLTERLREFEARRKRAS